MSSIHEVKCVTKDDRLNPYEHITQIGCLNSSGAYWRTTQKEAIRGIEEGSWKFFVTKYGKPVIVIVAISRFGHKYIKTENDGEIPNNLLSLPSCVN